MRQADKTAAPPTTLAGPITATPPVACLYNATPGECEARYCDRSVLLIAVYCGRPCSVHLHPASAYAYIVQQKRRVAMHPDPHPSFQSGTLPSGPRKQESPTRILGHEVSEKEKLPSVESRERRAIEKPTPSVTRGRRSRAGCGRLEEPRARPRTWKGGGSAWWRVQRHGSRGWTRLGRGRGRCLREWVSRSAQPARPCGIESLGPWRGCCWRGRRLPWPKRSSAGRPKAGGSFRERREFGRPSFRRERWWRGRDLA